MAAQTSWARHRAETSVRGSGTPARARRFRVPGTARLRAVVWLGAGVANLAGLWADGLTLASLVEPELFGGLAGLLRLARRLRRPSVN